MLSTSFVDSALMFFDFCVLILPSQAYNYLFESKLIIPLPVYGRKLGIYLQSILEEKWCLSVVAWSRILFVCLL